jgi:hypothetical protein
MLWQVGVIVDDDLDVLDCTISPERDSYGFPSWRVRCETYPEIPSRLYLTPSPRFARIMYLDAIEAYVTGVLGAPPSKTSVHVMS